MKYKKDSELYLKTYPKLLKWINVCPFCKKKGYKPEMPESIGLAGSVAAKNLRSYFQPLEVDEYGICLDCVRAMMK